MARDALSNALMAPIMLTMCVNNVVNSVVNAPHLSCAMFASMAISKSQEHAKLPVLLVPMPLAMNVSPALNLVLHALVVILSVLVVNQGCSCSTVPVSLNVKLALTSPTTIVYLVMITA